VNLLQGVIEKASGQAFEDSMRQHVWGPSGMLATAFDIPARIVPRRARSYRLAKTGTQNAAYGDLTYKFAGGGMLSTAEDLVRLGVALNHGQLLKPETIALLYKPHLDPVLRFQKNGPPEKEDFQQGLLWRINHDAAGRRFVYHCGTVKGFQSCLVNYVEEDLVVAILLNAETGGGWRDNLALAELFRTPAAKP
jgi:CubicO group peptidase (beta-lactamase class C family)